jgi:hypothetical protein
MKKFLITCDTIWCGTRIQYRAEAESEKDLRFRADNAAEDNYYETVYDEDDDEAEPYYYKIQEFPEELDWNDYDDLP